MPEDLSEDNLSTWAGIVQDVVAGMIVPHSGTDQTIFPQVVEILTLLESVSRVTFCRQCYLLGSACRCLGSSSTTSTASTTGLSWSEVANPTYSPNTASAGRGAGTAGSSIWDPPSTDVPGLPGAPSTSHQQPHPAGRGAFLQRQLKAIPQGKTPDLLRLPRLTWDPPTTQNRRVQLPLPPPKSDQSQQTTAQNPEPERQETQRPGRARARSRYRGPWTIPRQPHTSQPAPGCSGGGS